LTFVINHTSTQHPFFAEANSKPQSRYRNWYVWSANDPGNGWARGNDGYYYAYFWGGMPDLNFNNPEVTHYMHAVTRYWLNDIGIDGFRVDAAKHLIEVDGKIENTEETRAWFRGWYPVYKNANPQAYTVSEIYGAGAFLAKTYTGDQFDHVFNFEIANGIVNSSNNGAISGIESALKFALKDLPEGNYATFLTNHDQNRVMSVFRGDVNKAKVAAAILLTAPGTPYLYYGEEIGMQGVKPDEDLRLPMQWSNAPYAGFSDSGAWRAPHADYPQVNVAAQESDPNSLLNHYRTLGNLRRTHAALRTGSTVLVNGGHSGVYSIIRQGKDENILVVINLRGESISNYQLRLDENTLRNGNHTPVTLFGEQNAAPVRVNSGKFEDYKPLETLAPYGVYIFKLP
jgi:alpha-amylase